MDWHPIQWARGVEILLVTSSDMYRNWNECWPDGLLGTLCRLDFHRLSCHLQNKCLCKTFHMIFMRMTVQVAYIFILIIRTKTHFATKAK